MDHDIPVYIGSEALPALVQHCRHYKESKFLLVADERTYAALGSAVEDALLAEGWDVKTVVLSGDEVIADAHYVMQVMLAVDAQARVFLAVGSGTITDITRFVSHRTHAEFISIPTAPSVDGFTSIGAPMIINGLKETVIAQPPTAIFADLETLRRAPRPMIASGFGDMIGKFTSVADWQLGHLIWDEPYDETIAERSRSAARQCVRHAQEIGAATEAGVRVLIANLIESGKCMLDFGSSRPASGAEHHCSHFWEMKLLQEHRPAILHGAKVGVATIFIAQEYEKIRNTTLPELKRRLDAAQLPDREKTIAQLEAVYGPIAGEIVTSQREFLDMSPQEFEDLKARLIQHWPQVQEIAGTVPRAAELTEMLKTVGGPTTPEELGLHADEVAPALEYSHYLRNRFTVNKLKHLLNVI